MPGYITPNKISWRIYHYDTSYIFNKTLRWFTIQFCWARFTDFRFDTKYKVDFRECCKDSKEPTPFGKNWKGTIIEFLGISIMFKTQIK